jgi:S1-C subfamily serine protease
MKNFLNALVLMLSLLILNSCAAQTNVIKSMADAKKSILKIETWISGGECDQANMSCTPQKLIATGTGAVVLYSNKKVVLTAAHICVQDRFRGISKEDLGHYFKAVDRTDKEYIIKIIKYDAKNDICILESVSGHLEPSFIPMSRKIPEYAEMGYNLAAPMGIIDGEMVPIFEGRFFGIVNDPMYGRDTVAVYGMPAIGGSSGSPVVNARGELIGMVHSVHFRFHHITLSATYQTLWNFLNASHTQIIQSQKQSQH